jgi:homoserine kinase
MSTSRIFVPGSIGNVGPGFDVLGLAVAEIGDTFEVKLGKTATIEVSGRDAADIPLDPDQNCATIAARALLRSIDVDAEPQIQITRQLPLAGGLGASAAASVGGAFSACLAAGANVEPRLIMQAALVGESAVAGAHLDNIAPSLLGGLCICYGVEPPLVTKISVIKPWWLTLLTPKVKMKTKDSRNILPEASTQKEWVQQMGYTSALVAAFASGDADLLRNSLHDPFAEPRRKALIPHFDEVKACAINAGALACSISGAGPTIFAISQNEDIALDCAKAMSKPFGTSSGGAREEFSIITSSISNQGVHYE